MKVKVLKGFYTTGFGKRAKDEVFEVDASTAVDSLVEQGYLQVTRAEPTVDLADDSSARVDTTSTATPARAGKPSKSAKGTK